MPVKSNPKIALIGNPNSGKSSLFNQLTGLHQKVGNFPGVTIEKRTGLCRLDEYITAQIIDLPGTYSLYARCAEEKTALEVLNNPSSPFFPDILVFIADAANLKRNLLLFSQVRDLGIPMVLALNMLDVARQAGISLQVERLQELLGVKVIPINARAGEGLEKLKYVLTNPVRRETEPFFDVYPLAPRALEEVKQHFALSNNYSAYQLLQQGGISEQVSADDQAWLSSVRSRHQFNSEELQAKETIGRYQHIYQILARASRQLRANRATQLLNTFDAYLTHPGWGYAIFAGLLLLLFQLVFWLGNIPLGLLDGLWSGLTTGLQTSLPQGWFNSLLTTSVLPSLGGVLLFVPHLVVFFTLMALLEESGYMTRIMLLMDKLMRRFGLNGRSALPLLSTAACSMPALLARGSCRSWRERSKQIFVAPLVNCSPRLPVYILLIGLFVPAGSWGLLSVQGLVLLAMYGFSFVAAVVSSWVLKLLVRARAEESFVMELPYFSRPYWRDIRHIVGVNLTEIGMRSLRVVLPVSAFIWLLLHLQTVVVSGGDADKAPHAGLEPGKLELKAELGEQESLAGHIGHLIAPVVKPLGFDGNIGLAVLSSFAAREAFIGSLATISSQAPEQQEKSLLARIRQLYPQNGSAIPPMVISLLVFYAFAMQYFHLAGTLLRQSPYWWAPLLQLVYMTGLAYLAAYLVNQLFS
ncbi:ferrous iron transport protein B [Cesiribacter andamanensis]|uniref:Ferrous iron transport protein B n=1 Tax=Cesiribacter andamanensis AMV16 TaxID=1279009 RepID=M7N4C5_9BACT|nr:ferrous iron transport protein B [Cesiribacter andamanensis]EMR02142.1 Ferrous iron transport protein B [Cesiribacter andamanensis AMV16]